jgi:hypothetical protein
MVTARNLYSGFGLMNGDNRWHTGARRVKLCMRVDHKHTYIRVLHETFCYYM